MVRNLELWQEGRERERGGQLGQVGGRKRSLRSQGAANLRIFSFQLRAARPAARTSLGYSASAPGRWPHVCLAGICVCAAAIDTGHTRTGKARASALCQRDAAQHSADKTSLGCMIYAKVSWLPGHLLCLLWSWDLAWVSGCLAVVPGTGTGTDPLAGAMDQGKAIISGCPRRRVLQSVPPPSSLLLSHSACVRAGFLFLYASSPFVCEKLS